jgi:hypothetical protein
VEGTVLPAAAAATTATATAAEATNRQVGIFYPVIQDNLNTLVQFVYPMDMLSCSEYPPLKGVGFMFHRSCLLVLNK